MTSLRELNADLHYVEDQLRATAKVEVAKFTGSKFLTNGEEIRKIVEEALKHYRNDDDLKDRSRDEKISIVAGELASNKIKAGYFNLSEIRRTLEKDEKIEKFIKDKYNKSLWNSNFHYLLARAIQREIQKEIIKHIAPVLTKEIEKEESNCNLM